MGPLDVVEAKVAVEPGLGLPPVGVGSSGSFLGLVDDPMHKKNQPIYQNTAKQDKPLRHIRGLEFPSQGVPCTGARTIFSETAPALWGIVRFQIAKPSGIPYSPSSTSGTVTVSNSTAPHGSPVSSSRSQNPS